VLSPTEWNSLIKSKFNPNKLFDVSDVCSIKLLALDKYNKKLRPFPHSRSIETIEALSIYRGATIGLKKAESFQIERIVE